MVDFEQLIAQLENDQFRKSQFAEKGEMNVLFINPDLSGENLYKMVLPYLHLPLSGVVNTAMLGLHKFNPVKRYASYPDIQIRPQELYWANTVVFPFTSISLYQPFQYIRQFNPHANIVIHIDFDFMNVPPEHPYAALFMNEQTQKNILTNIRLADTVVVDNHLLIGRIFSRMQEMGLEVDKMKFKTMILATSPEYLFNCMGADQHRLFKTVLELKPKQVDEQSKEPQEIEVEVKVEGEQSHVKRIRNDKFTLGVIISDTQISDLEESLPALVEAGKKYKDELEIVLMGCNIEKPNWKKTKALLKHAFSGAEKKANQGATFTSSIGNFVFEKPVPIWKFYDLMVEVNPDIILIPNNNSSFSTVSNDYKRFLDAALMQIPIISPKVEPFAKIIQMGKNGYLFSDKKSFLEILDTLIKKREVLDEVGIGAYDTMINNFVFNETVMQDLVSILA